MIKKKYEVKNINYSILEPILCYDIKHAFPKGDFFNIDFPLEFTYNSIWYYSYKCCNCFQVIKIGYTNDLIANTIKYKTLSGFNTLRYSKNFLNNLTLIFYDLKLIKPEHSDHFFLTFNFFNEAIFDSFLIPSPDLVYYNCNQCNLTYLGILKDIPIQSPGKGNENGELGLVKFNQLIGVELNVFS